MRLVRLESAKSGATAEGRRVLSAVTATSLAPTTSDQGVPLRGGEGFWAEVVLGGTTPEFDVQYWVYSYTALAWLPFSTGVYTASIRDRFVCPGGPIRVYAQVTAVSGTNPTMSLWLVEYYGE